MELSSSRPILVAGSIVYDTVAGPVAALQWETTEWVTHFSAGVGGNGASTAYAAALLGTRVVLQGAVGSDAAGDSLLGALRGAGVNIEAVCRRTGVTAASVAIFHPDGRRSLLHTPGVGLEAEFQLLPGCGHLHIANPFALPALRRGASRLLMEARRSGMSTSLDLGWDRLGEWMQVIGQCLPSVDILFANEVEAGKLEGLLPRHLVVKCGAEGCRVDGEQIGGYDVPAVDTTGAGDCFCGAFLAALTRGLSMKDAARVANAAAALSVQHPGATPGLRSWSETCAWMALR